MGMKQYEKMVPLSEAAKAVVDDLAGETGAYVVDITCTVRMTLPAIRFDRQEAADDYASSVPFSDAREIACESDIQEWEYQAVRVPEQDSSASDNPHDLVCRSCGRFSRLSSGLCADCEDQAEAKAALARLFDWVRLNVLTPIPDDIRADVAAALADDDRCDACGAPLDGDGYDGKCADCVEALANSCEEN